jgi:hypothetical protein
LDVLDLFPPLDVPAQGLNDQQFFQAFPPKPPPADTSSSPEHILARSTGLHVVSAKPKGKAIDPFKAMSRVRC